MTQPNYDDPDVIVVAVEFEGPMMAGEWPQQRQTGRYHDTHMFDPPAPAIDDSDVALWAAFNWAVLGYAEEHYRDAK